MEGASSEWLKQETGIIQGCPLSPYLFLIVMTTIFHDIYNKDEVKAAMADSGILGSELTEVLYAGDTILITNTTE